MGVVKYVHFLESGLYQASSEDFFQGFHAELHFLQRACGDAAPVVEWRKGSADSDSFFGHLGIELFDVSSRLEKHKVGMGRKVGEFEFVQGLGQDGLGFVIFLEREAVKILVEECRLACFNGHDVGIGTTRARSFVANSGRAIR